MEGFAGSTLAHNLSILGAVFLGNGSAVSVGISTTEHTGAVCASDSADKTLMVWPKQPPGNPLRQEIGCG